MTPQRDSTLAAHGWVMPRSIWFVVASWRTLTWKHFLYTFLLSLTWTMAEIAGSMPEFWETGSWGPAFNNIVSMQLNGFAVLLAVMVADRGSPPPSCHWWSYLLAVVVGVVVGSTLAWLVTQHLLQTTTAFQATGRGEAIDTFVFRHATHRFVVCALVTCVYVLRRLAAHRMAALRVVQLNRVGVEKRVLESRLAAMQAHVDPQFLRDTLSRVERLYEIDARAADRMLKDLTQYLRAAIPQTTDPASTVATEIRLTNAFLNIVALQPTDLLAMTSTTSIEEVARMPRMVLLPLIQQALAHRTKRAEDGEQFRIDVAVRDDRLVLTICDPEAGFATNGASDPEIRRLKDRLAGLYGGSAQLTLRDTANGSQAVLQLPYELAGDPLIEPRIDRAAS